VGTWFKVQIVPAGLTSQLGDQKGAVGFLPNIKSARNSLLVELWSWNQGIIIATGHFHPMVWGHLTHYKKNWCKILTS
jgi:hypothetical protein